MNAIETVHLRKYYGKARGIEDVTLAVAEGEIFGFIGPNGAGKSTTIRTLLNFIFPTSGEARIRGMDVVRESAEIRAVVGYLPSEVGYYDDMTVRQLLQYSASFHRLSGTEAGARIDQLAAAFDLDLTRRTHALSLGNRRKVGIILALLHRPPVLILDEPTGNLDPLMQARLFEVLAEENRRGTTVFFSSHVLSEVQRFCHRVAILKEGRVLAVEAVDRLRRSQFQKVRVEFAGLPAPDLMNMPGALHVQQISNRTEMLYSGDVNDLLRLLAEHRLTALSLEEPPLEDVFMHYYQAGGEQR